MKYSELLKLYKEGNLDKEQIARVERDIERQQSISEYLFVEEQIFDFDEEGALSVDDNATKNEVNFVDMVNKSIRKAFIKMGVVSGTIIIAIVMLIIFVLPKAVNLFYYNPSAVVGEKNGIETNQMSLDMAVYTELYSPNHYSDYVSVEDNGYADYDIYIPQNFYIDGRKIDVAGKIKRNKLTLFNPNVFEEPYIGAFVTEEIGLKTGFSRTDLDGDIEASKKMLQGLDENEFYRAYITMSDVKTYSELVSWCEANNVIPEWCNICTKQDDEYYFEDNTGFIYSTSCTELYYDNEKYPYLTQFDLSLSSDDFDKAYSEEIMETHFISMLKYMSEQEEFCKMMGIEPEFKFYDELIKNVEENGLNIFGFTVVAQKDEILKISETQDVYYVYTEDI